VFWAHLTAGVTAGTVILIMCVTGVCLAYERELLSWADRGIRSTHVEGQARLGAGELLANLEASHPGLEPTALTMAADAGAPAAVTTREGRHYVDAYSGVLLADGSVRVRRFMERMRAWHRWLAVDGPGRPVARIVTGYSNLIFLFIVVSGFYLWFPRVWTWRRVRPVIFFKGRLRGKARDFNWHNTIGSWACVPLFIIVLCALPMSFPWANAALYRVTGDEPPRPGGRTATNRARGATGQNARIDPAVLDAAWTRAAAQVPGWRTMTVRLPANANAPLTFAIDRGDGGQPQMRSTLTLDRQAHVLRYETFGDQPSGARLRAITRFAHTGEVLGITGQTIAGITTAGGAVLAWTGVALAIRRLRASLPRRRTSTPARNSASEPTAA
jgi:uncharacterized iron-regulated membrane protein